MSHHYVTVKDIPAGGEKLDLSRLSKLMAALKLTSLVGFIASIVFFAIVYKFDTTGFVGQKVEFSLSQVYSYSWLFAFMAAFTLCFGGLFWVLLHNASNSAWGVVIRRLAENLANVIPWVALLGLPIVLVPHIREGLYEWIATHAHLSHGGAEHGLKEALHHTNHLMYHKFGYLSLYWGAIPGWLPRYFIFFAILWCGAAVLRRYSVSQDLTGNVMPTLSARRFSCGWLPLFAVSVTFASFDWVKSINYTWFSTMFGVNFFVGGALSSMALLIVLVVTLKEWGYLKGIVTEEHLHLMGKLMFAFTVFWAYIAFSQYFLIWYANIPEETQFYAIRNTDGWCLYSILFLTIGHFIAPFVFLLWRNRKRNPNIIRAAAIFIIFVHLAELYWFIIPERGPRLADRPTIIWAFLFDVIALVTVFSFIAWRLLKEISKHSLYPCGDPRLQESINVVS
jgi:hypothetical protein